MIGRTDRVTMVHVSRSGKRLMPSGKKGRSFIRKRGGPQNDGVKPRQRPGVSPFIRTRQL